MKTVRQGSRALGWCGRWVVVVDNVGAGHGVAQLEAVRQTAGQRLRGRQSTCTYRVRGVGAVQLRRQVGLPCVVEGLECRVNRGFTEVEHPEGRVRIGLLIVGVRGSFSSGGRSRGCSVRLHKTRTGCARLHCDGCRGPIQTARGAACEFKRQMTPKRIRSAGRTAGSVAHCRKSGVRPVGPLALPCGCWASGAAARVAAGAPVWSLSTGLCRAVGKLLGFRLSGWPTVSDGTSARLPVGHTSPAGPVAGRSAARSAALGGCRWLHHRRQRRLLCNPGTLLSACEVR